MLNFRSTLRRLGLTKLIAKILGLPAQFRQKRELIRYRREKPSIVTVELNDTRVLLHVDNETEFARALSYRTDAHILKHLLGHLSNAGDAWDVGANFGLYSLLMAQCMRGSAGAVHAFDPDPWCQKRIQDNAELNDLRRISVMPVGLSNAKERAHLELSSASVLGTGHLTGRKLQGVESDEQIIEVEVYPGDWLRGDRKMKVPAVIKIDVEGFELEVLQGLAQTLADKECQYVLVEVHFALLEKRGLNHVPKEIKSLLKDAGFNRLSWLDFSHLAASKV